MRCPSNVLAFCFVACVLAVVMIHIESAKRSEAMASDASAMTSDAKPMASSRAPLQTASELDPRITKVGDLPEPLTAEYFACQLHFINEQEGWLSVLAESGQEPRESGRLWRTRD